MKTKKAMFTVTFNKKDREKALEIFGAPSAEHGSVFAYEKDFSVDLLEQACDSGLVFYGSDKGRFGEWRFVCDGEGHAIQDFVDGKPAYDNNETKIFFEMLESVKTLIEEGL